MDDLITSEELFTNKTIDKKVSFSFNEEYRNYKIFLHNDSFFVKNKSYCIDFLNSSNEIIDCTFTEDVLITQMDTNITFKNCTFKKKIIFNLEQKKEISYDTTYQPDNKGEKPIEVTVYKNLTKEKIEFVGGKIDTLEIKNSSFESKFYINPQYTTNDKKLKITNLLIDNTVFNENFKLHHCDITTFKIVDTDFERNADFFLTKISKGSSENTQNKTILKDSIVFKSINFKSLAIFGDTTFKEKLVFKYVTFEGFSHFRNAEFQKGLDLDYSNIQEEMNFFGAKELDNDISKKNTSQETYRIIKHNFEKIGNKIDANKYHALELEQKKNNLLTDIQGETDKDIRKIKLLEYIIFKTHWISSEHSTNWFLVLLWILTIGLFSTIIEKEPFLISVIPTSLFITLFMSKNQYKLLFFILVFTVSIWLTKCIEFTDVIKNISLVSLDTDKPVLMFFNKITMGYLYYQFLMSVRKDTRK